MKQVAAFVFGAFYGAIVMLTFAWFFEGKMISTNPEPVIVAPVFVATVSILFYLATKANE